MGRGYTFKNEEFKDLRVRTGMTQQEIADAVGMSKSQISRIEKSGHNPYMKTIIRLAEAVGVDRDRLVQYDSDARITQENREKVGEAQAEWEKHTEEAGEGMDARDTRAGDRGT